ncbi:M20 family metallopeptidase [Paenibacillus abyssi]|uniref:Amidohydrolase YhaA n=1 Tax=Paenibacillus abyssi TaxID=1340531 RepID=A0A917FY09_9BACL|nr:M20 family metallopeptidase [Paenibacillus abyssi]GGG13089.1 putative amidohydrolase YhaA [Paenibacillus abyssi]
MCANRKAAEALQSLFPDMVGWRRYLHQYPELSFHEKKTSRYIAEQLAELGCEVKSGVGGYGIVATIKGGEPGPTVALRADIDALPIHDEKTTEYASKVPGVMHACGHDAHTATLLGVAKYYNEQRASLKGNRRLIFQPAEEVSPGGALPMIKEGVLDGVDAIYGVHLWTPVPYGKVASRPGAFMAAADEFSIEVIGKGGHGGLPHQTVDAIIVGSALVQALQTIVSRNVNPLEPAVVSIGSFHAGNTANVIAERVELQGTVRTFNTETRDFIRQRIMDMVQQTCSLFGAEGRLNYREGYPPVLNHKQEAERFFRIGREIVGEQQTLYSELIMAGEDFSYYLHEKPGCFMFVGAGKESLHAIYPHHHPKFDLDERAMVVSGSLLIGMAEDYVNGSAPC